MDAIKLARQGNLVVLPQPPKELREIFPSIDSVLSHTDLVHELKRLKYDGLFIRGNNTLGMFHGSIFVPANEENEIFIVRGVNNLKKQSKFVDSLAAQIEEMRKQFDKVQICNLKIKILIWKQLKRNETMPLDTLKVSLQEKLQVTDVDDLEVTELPKNRSAQKQKKSGKFFQNASCINAVYKFNNLAAHFLKSRVALRRTYPK